MVEFKYFKDFKRNAIFVDTPCDKGHESPFLDGEYFDGNYEDQGICVECLIKGRKVVHIQKLLRDNLYKCVADNADRVIWELERTPPVPWIQYNNWPLCCSDAMQYRGEYSTSNTFDDDELYGMPDVLWNIIDEIGKLQANNYKSLIQSLNEGMSACFIFKCLKCGRFEAVCQSY